MSRAAVARDTLQGNEMNLVLDAGEYDFADEFTAIVKMAESLHQDMRVEIEPAGSVTLKAAKLAALEKEIESPIVVRFGEPSAVELEVGESTVKAVLTFIESLTRLHRVEVRIELKRDRYGR